MPLDLTRPHVGGSEAFRETRRHRSNVRAALSGGFATKEATSGSEVKGPAGFLRKPFRTDDPLKVVFKTLGP